MSWHVAGKTFDNRLLLGTARYPSPAILLAAIQQAAIEIVTVSVRRELAQQKITSGFFELIQQTGCSILPNTAGCKSAEEAVYTAKLAREIWQTNWIKLEVIGDDYTLQPDPIELIIAAKALIAEGFIVFPYCTEDLVIAKKLVNVGCDIIMPWAAPIGSNQGILHLHGLTLLRERLPKTTLIVDAGIGAPSQAAQVLEIGFDGVLLNTAVAAAADPIQMACAFTHAVRAGHLAYQAGLVPPRESARASTPVVGDPIWLK